MHVCTAPLTVVLCCCCRACAGMGVVFCRWLATNTSCPICRKDLDASDDQPSSSSADSRRQQQGQPGQPDSSQATGDSCSRPGTQVGEEELLRRQVGRSGVSVSRPLPAHMLGHCQHTCNLLTHCQHTCTCQHTSGSVAGLWAGAGQHPCGAGSGRSKQLLALLLSCVVAPFQTWFACLFLSWWRCLKLCRCGSRSWRSG
jgi:hypothetical protein